MNIIQFAQLNCTWDSSTRLLSPLMKSCMCVYMWGWCIELGWKPCSLSSHHFSNSKKGPLFKASQGFGALLADGQWRMLRLIGIPIKLQLPTFLKSLILFPCCVKFKHLSLETDPIFSGTEVGTLKSQTETRSFCFPIFFKGPCLFSIWCISIELKNVFFFCVVPKKSKI